MQIIKRIILASFLTIALFTITACGAPNTGKDFQMATGNDDVPIGEYSHKIFEYYGVDEKAVSNHIHYGSNAKEVTTAISEGMADCGFVYATDAYTADLQIVAVADEDMCGSILYPAAILKGTKNRTSAEHFLKYMQSKEAEEIFNSIGFIGVSSIDQVPDVNDNCVDDDSAEVVVFAAASMTEALTEIAEKYETIAPNVKLVFNFDSSGTLKRQIEEGAECDVFVSAALKQMDEIDITCGEDKNPNRLDYIDSETRVNLLENKVVLCVSEVSKYKIDGFETLFQILEEQ